MRRALVIPVFFAWAAAAAQEGTVRTWVDNTTQIAGEVFELHLEVVGPVVGDVSMAPVDGLHIRPVQNNRSFTFVNGQTSQTIKIVYHVTAATPGTFTIPPVTAKFGNSVEQSEPITLTILTGGGQPAQGDGYADAWVDQTTVRVGVPFRIYVQGIGNRVDVPAIRDIPGLELDPTQTMRTNTFERRRGQVFSKVVHGFLVTAQDPGTIEIPALDVIIDGERYSTRPFTITAAERQPMARAGRTELYKEDLLFTKIFVDKDEVYQGEPVLLTMELWRIDDRRITTGAPRGADIRLPTTEGFYRVDLEPRRRTDMENSLPYDVIADRKLLFPTQTGDLTIGSWHWEGIATWPLNRSNSFFSNEREQYTFDSDPITVRVRPLPERPDEFSGAVGQFDIQVTLSDTSLLQGVPVKLLVEVKGAGNPDAVGDPKIPPLPWAHISGPERNVETYIIPQPPNVDVAKRFLYIVTPLKAGPAILPNVRYTYFDPDLDAYETKTAGSIELAVLPSAEPEQRLVVTPAATGSGEQISILAEDIRPPMERPAELTPKRSVAVTPAVAIAPIAMFLSLLGYAARKRRFDTDIGFARAYHGKTKALRRLREVSATPEPAEELYRAMSIFVGDMLNLDETGMTSEDARRQMKERNVDPSVGESVVRILRACERARYAAQKLSTEEIDALVRGAEAAVQQLDLALRGGKDQ